MTRLGWLIAALLALVVAGEWLWPVPAPSVPPVPAPPDPQERVEDAMGETDMMLGFAPPAPYEEIAERPLFYKDRRPPPPPPADDQPVKKEPAGSSRVPRIKLHAIVGEGKRLEALVTLPGERTTSRLKKGDKVDGWRVKAVEPDRLVLSSRGHKEEIELRKYRPVPPQRIPPKRQTPRRMPPRTLGKAPRRVQPAAGRLPRHTAPRTVKQPAGVPEP